MTTSDGQLPESRNADAVRLSLGQRLVLGNVESVDSASRSVSVQGLVLRFWGGYAIRNQLIKKGDRAVFVYQKLPVFGTKYVLVFWRGVGFPVRGVGVVIHACFLGLGIAGPGIMRTLGTEYPVWFTPICAALVLESCTYLLLWFYARRALYGFINNKAVR